MQALLNGLMMTLNFGGSAEGKLSRAGRATTMTQEQIDPIQNAIDALELAQRFIPLTSYKLSYDAVGESIYALQQYQLAQAARARQANTSPTPSVPDALTFAVEFWQSKAHHLPVHDQHAWIEIYAMLAASKEGQ